MGAADDSENTIRKQGLGSGSLGARTDKRPPTTQCSRLVSRIPPNPLLGPQTQLKSVSSLH